MPGTRSHSVKLAEDKKTIRIEIARDGMAQWDDLGPCDVDLLMEALRDLRKQMIEDPAKPQN